jgi:hypothetical protein
MQKAELVTAVANSDLFQNVHWQPGIVHWQPGVLCIGSQVLCRFYKTLYRLINLLRKKLWIEYDAEESGH